MTLPHEAVRAQRTAWCILAALASKPKLQQKLIAEGCKRLNINLGDTGTRPSRHFVLPAELEVLHETMRRAMEVKA